MTLIVSFQMAKSLLSETLQYGHSRAKQIKCGKIRSQITKTSNKKKEECLVTLFGANSMYHAVKIELEKLKATHII